MGVQHKPLSVGKCRRVNEGIPEKELQTVRVFMGDLIFTQSRLDVGP